MLIRLDSDSGAPVFVNPDHVTSLRQTTGTGRGDIALTIVSLAEGLQGTTYVVQGSISYIASLLNDRHEP